MLGPFFKVEREISNSWPLVSVLFNILVSRPDDDSSLELETSCYRIKLFAKCVLVVTVTVTPTAILHIKRHKTIISHV